MKSCAFLVGFLAVIGACSSKETSDPYPTVSAFCEAWGKAACNSQVVRQCSGMTPTNALTDQCIQSQQLFCEGLVPDTGYSSTQAQRCLDAVGAAYSDPSDLSGSDIATVRHLGAPCNHLIKGPVPIGGSCTEDNDCNTLQNVLCVMKSGVGTCVVPTVVPNGNACDAPEAACNPGYYCDGANCVQSHSATSSAKCTADFECASGLSCDATSGKCTPRVDPSMCMADGDCTTGVCDITGTSTTGACVDSITLSRAEAICGDLR